MSDESLLSFQLLTVGGCSFNPMAIAAIDWNGFPLFFETMGWPLPAQAAEVQAAPDKFEPAITIMFVGGGDFEYVGIGAASFFTWYLQATGKAKVQLAHAPLPPRSPLM